jgi:hypothetical protein
MEHELDAAEFFVKRAISLAKRDGVDYAAAEHDLALIQSRRPAAVAAVGTEGIQ